VEQGARDPRSASHGSFCFTVLCMVLTGEHILQGIGVQQGLGHVLGMGIPGVLCLLYFFWNAFLERRRIEQQGSCDISG
jgi:hypothetical protein